MLNKIKQKFIHLLEPYSLNKETIHIHARPLSPEESIGNPEEKDFPLFKGRERLIEAEVRGTRGVAFTDMYGNYEGKLEDILKLELTNNFRRAVFVASLNALLRYLKVIDRTEHCKNEEPNKCADELVSFIQQQYGKPKVLLVGYQPRFVKMLSVHFPLKVIDMDIENIGKNKFGVNIDGPSTTQLGISWCDVLFVTGSTLVNNTINQFLDIPKPKLFYGVTIAGVSKLLNLPRFCPYGH